MRYREHIHKRPRDLDLLPDGYGRLFDRVVEVLDRDDRVRAAWLGGSFGRGDTDAASDLDFMVAVADASFVDLTSSWVEWIDTITPTAHAHAHTFARGMYYAATPDMCRLDITVEKVSDVENSLFPTRCLIFDRDGLDDRLPAPWLPSGPSADRVRTLVEEWFRITAMPETILVRDDWLLADVHVHWMRAQLYQLYCEANAPVPTTGIKRYAAKLTAEQRETLLALPASATNRTELVAAHVLSSAAFLATARPLAAELGVAWPEALERAATRHVAAVLEVDDPYPS